MLSLYSLSCKTKKEKNLIAGYVVGCRLQIKISAFHKVTPRPEVSIRTGSGSKYNLVPRFSFLLVPTERERRVGENPGNAVGQNSAFMPSRALEFVLRRSLNP